MMFATAVSSHFSRPTRPGFRHTALLLGLGALLAASAASAQVATGTTGINASGNYASERAACLNGQTQQDQATCLKEAGAAAADKRRGTLDNSGSQFQANATQRCKVLTGVDRTACEARVMGYGNTKGSVAGGGVITQTEVVAVPAGTPAVTFEAQTNGPVLVVPTPAQ